MPKRISLKIVAWAFIVSGVLLFGAAISWVHGALFALIGLAGLKFFIPQIEKWDREDEILQQAIIEQIEMREKIVAQTAALKQEHKELKEFIERMREQGLAT